MNLVPANIAALPTHPPAGHFDMGFVGDIYARDDFLAEHGSPPVSALRGSIWQPLAGASLVVANLETTLTDLDTQAERKPYVHKAPVSVLGLFDDRFVLSLANNHVMDYGPQGLADTLAALDGAGIAYAGAGATLQQARAPRLLTIEGVRVAVLCAADPRFSPATATSPGTFPAHARLLDESVRTARAQADLVVVSLHMGLEHVSVPSAAQIALADVCRLAGAQIVHFHHAHRLSGAASDGSCFVLFGTGNYVFTKLPRVPVPTSKQSAAWRIRICARSGQTVAVGADAVQLDPLGLPQRLQGPAAEFARVRLQRCSDVMLRGAGRQWTRLHDLTRPGFLRFNAYNYGYLLRQRGPLYVLKALASGLRAQFGRRAGAP